MVKQICDSAYRLIEMAWHYESYPVTMFAGDCWKRPLHFLKQFRGIVATAFRKPPAFAFPRAWRSISKKGNYHNLVVVKQKYWETECYFAGFSRQHIEHFTFWNQPKTDQLYYCWSCCFDLHNCKIELENTGRRLDSTSGKPPFASVRLIGWYK